MNDDGDDDGTYILTEDETSLKDIHSDCDFLGDYTHV